MTNKEVKEYILKEIIEEKRRLEEAIKINPANELEEKNKIELISESGGAMAAYSKVLNALK